MTLKARPPSISARFISSFEARGAPRQIMAGTTKPIGAGGRISRPGRNSDSIFHALARWKVTQRRPGNRRRGAESRSSFPETRGPCGHRVWARAASSYQPSCGAVHRCHDRGRRGAEPFIRLQCCAGIGADCVSVFPLDAHGLVEIVIEPAGKPETIGGCHRRPACRGSVGSDITYRIRRKTGCPIGRKQHWPTMQPGSLCKCLSGRRVAVPGHRPSYALPRLRNEKSRPQAPSRRTRPSRPAAPIGRRRQVRRVPAWHSIKLPTAAEPSEPSINIASAKLSLSGVVAAAASAGPVGGLSGNRRGVRVPRARRKFQKHGVRRIEPDDNPRLPRRADREFPDRKRRPYPVRDSL